MTMTAFELAQRWIGIRELPGNKDNQPFIMGMLKLDGDWPESDEVPWCSAFINFICWQLRLPRSKSLAARSWLNVGQVIKLEQAAPGNDLVVLSREGGGGHVGLFAGHGDHADMVSLLGGNQGDAVNVTLFPTRRIIGVRRLTADSY